MPAHARGPGFRAVPCSPARTLTDRFFACDQRRWLDIVGVDEGIHAECNHCQPVAERRALGHVRAPGGNALILALKQERHQTFGGSPQRQLFAVSGAQVSEFGGDEGGVGA